MILSAMLLLLSILVLAQFSVYYWRAVVAGVAAQPFSQRVLAAAGLAGGMVTANDFETLSGLHELTPTLSVPKQGLALVRAYYRIIHMLETLANSRVPSLASWSQRERAVCARYAAVQFDRLLRDNLACVAAIRSC